MKIYSIQDYLTLALLLTASLLAFSQKGIPPKAVVNISTSTNYAQHVDFTADIWVMNAKFNELNDNTGVPSKKFAIQKAVFKPIP